METLQQLKTTFTPFEKLEVLVETFKEINVIGQEAGGQTMTKAKHNRPILKLFDNWPLALAVKVFCETIGLVIYIQNIPIIVSFSLLLAT